MKKNILVIDDEKHQAEGLAKKLNKEFIIFEYDN